MKKELVIEMDEECIDCPFLRLETQMFADSKIMTHKCIHIDFCKVVRRNWEAHLREKMEAIKDGGKV